MFGNKMDKIIRRSKPGALLGEGCMWSKRDQCVYWVNILENKLNAYYLNGESRTWDFPEHICWVIEREKGGFIAGFMSGFAEVTLDPLTIKHIHNPYPHEPENRMNDAKADDRGRIWAGSMHKPITKTSGAWYRLNTDMTVTEVDGPYRIANGPAFTPDHTQVYHTDTGVSEIYVFDIGEDGELANKRLFLKFKNSQGYPDGMTFDAQGGLWIAHWGIGRVTRFKPDGREDFHVDLPAKQTSCICFAGDNLDRAFVTSAAEGVPAGKDKEAGTLFEIPSIYLRGHTGLEPQKFKG